MTSRIRPAALAVLVALLVALVPSSLVAQGLTRAVPESVGMSSERLERLTEALEGYVDDGQLAGAVAIVVRRGRIAYLEAVGQRDVASGSPMDTDAIFRIASQTKALVSTGVMLLQEEGPAAHHRSGRRLPAGLQEHDGCGAERRRRLRRGPAAAARSPSAISLRTRPASATAAAPPATSGRRPGSPAGTSPTATRRWVTSWTRLAGAAARRAPPARRGSTATTRTSSAR